MGLSNELSCEAGGFSHCCLNPHRCFQSVIWGFISLHWNSGLRGLSQSLPVVALPACCSLAHPAPQSAPSLDPPANVLPNAILHAPPCCESSPRAAGMDECVLSPWLSDFHTVQFSVSFGCFLFLNCCFLLLVV